MQIKRVRLFNIRSYLEEQIDFPLDSVLLSGDIGSGKSSILLAIEFALFGSRKGIGEALLRTGKREGFVELTFVLDNKEIVIKRALKRGKEGVKQEAGFIIINGIKSELTAEDLKSRILQLLGYPLEFLKRSTDILFRYTVYTPQEEMKKILTDEPELRLDTLRRVFSVDKYKRINENSRIIVKEIREKKKEIEGKTFDLELKRIQKKEYEYELHHLNENLEKNKPEFEILKKILSEIKIELKNLEDKLKEYLGLKNSYEILQARFSDKYNLVQKLNSNLNTILKEVEILRTKTNTSMIMLPEEELESKIDRNKDILVSTSSKKAKVESKLENLQLNLTELKRDVSGYDDAMGLLEQKQKALEQITFDSPKKLKDEINKMNEEFLGIISELIRLEDNILKSNELKSKITNMENCPLCNQHIGSEHKSHIKEVEEEKILSFRKQLAECNKRKEAINIKLAELNEVLEKRILMENSGEKISLEIKYLNDELTRIMSKKIAMDKIKQDLLRIEQENKEILNTDLDIINKETMELNKRLKQIKEIKNSLYQIELKEKAVRETEEQITDLKKEVGKINMSKAELFKELGSFQNIEDRHNKTKERYEQIAEEMKQKEISIAEIQKEITGSKRIIKNIDEEIKLKEKLRDKLYFLNNLENWIENFFVSLMENMEKHVMSSVYQEFNDFFQEWFNTLIEDENLSVRLDDTYSPVIEQNGYETIIENLSGGERTSCALAYRLALNKVINDVVGEIKTKDLIILDEPTEGFSSEQLDKVRIVLDQLGVRQVIIVSHEEKIESFVHHVIRIHKEEHVSKVMT